MKDLIITALKAARRDPKALGLFNRILANAQVYTFVRRGNRACLIRGEVSGKIRDYIACFSNPRLAVQTLKIYGGLAGNNIEGAEIKPVNALKFFFSAAQGRLAIYLNPKNVPAERLFFDLAEVKEFLSGPWALNFDQTESPGGRSRFLARSRRGRNPIDGENTQLPISEIDFDRPFTARQLAEIFGVSENDIVREIAELERGGLDLSALSISLDDPESERSGEMAARYYDPVVAFHVGHQIKGRRGDEFRQWHTRLLQDFYSERQTLATERDQLKDRLEATGGVIQSLESELNEKSELISGLEAWPAQAQASLNQLNQEVLLKNKQIAELKAELEAAGRWVYPESVGEACEAAQARYGSRLAFHDRVAQSVSEFSLNNDLRAVAEAVKMFRALAECLYPMKFEREEFSEELFRDETGITLSMTESRATKRDKALEDTRVCLYNGREIIFYPHLKKSVQGLQMRLHFQFLDDERKILICHLGEHLPNAKTRHLK